MDMDMVACLDMCVAAPPVRLLDSADSCPSLAHALALLTVWRLLSRHRTSHTAHRTIGRCPASTPHTRQMTKVPPSPPAQHRPTGGTAIPAITLLVPALGSAFTLALCRANLVCTLSISVSAALVASAHHPSHQLLRVVDRSAFGAIAPHALEHTHMEH